MALVRTQNPFGTLVRHRNFRLFWLGQTLSLIGTWMQSMAQGWLALVLTDNAFLVGAVAFAGSLPILLLSLHAGVYLESRDRLRVVKVAQALLALDAALLWWITWSGHATIGWVLALAAFNGVVSAIEIPARQSLVIELVGRDDLRDAIALNSSGFNLARIVGPSIGAIVVRQFGLAWCFGANALSYAAVLGGLAMVRLPPRAPAAPLGTPLEGIRALFAYMRGSREVTGLMGLVTVFAIFGAPYLTLMPVVARDLLGTGASGYGLLLSAVGVGGLMGALGLAALGGRLRRGRLLRLSAFAFPALLLAFALVRSVSLAYPLLFAIGFTMILNNALSNGLLQLAVPDAMRGRLMAAYSLVVVGLSQVVGSLSAGAVARLVGVQWAIGAGAVIMLAYALHAYHRYPEIGRL